MKITKIESKPFKPETVEIREPLVEDMIKAERIVGKATGIEFINAILSQVCTFDGKPQPPEEVQRLSSNDFLTLSDAAGLSDAPILPSESSTLSGKESGGKKE